MLLKVRNRMHICGGLGEGRTTGKREKLDCDEVTAKASADLGSSGAGMAFQNVLKLTRVVMDLGPWTFTMTSHWTPADLGERA